MMKHCKKMNLKYIIKLFLVVAVYLFTFSASVTAQPEQIIDQVAAVIGNKILLKSEIETQYQQIIEQGNTPSDELKCRITDQLLINK